MLTTFTLVLIGVVALAIVIVGAYYFQQARRREEAAPDPSDAIVEMRALGQRIETLVGQQQLHGETTRQQLAQKMDAVGQTVDQQRHHLSGLQNEIRHEVRRRDAEMEDIRTQLASIQQAAQPAARLEASAAARVLPEAAEAAREPDPFSAPETPQNTAAPADAMPVFETPAFEIPVFETPAFGTPAFGTPVFGTNAFQSGDGVATFSDDGWDTGEPAAALPVFSDPFASDEAFAGDEAPLPVFEDVAPFESPEEAPSSEFEPFDFVPPADASPALGHGGFEMAASVTFEALTPAPSPSPQSVPPPSQTAWISLAGRAEAPEVPVFKASLEAPAAPFSELPVAAPIFTAPAFEMSTFDAPASPAPEPAAAPSTPTAPAGADRLTLIASIDDATQAALYATGVTTLDEIARWSRSDARRIAAEISASEDEIMTLWIFEAQAALFQSYAVQQGQ